MYNKEYISYINSLHNYNAQNPNSYGEKNVNNRFFKDVMVEVGLSQFIVGRLEENESHAIILTGHAGDGKTSIMYQVLNKLGIQFDPNKKFDDYLLPSGKKCRCIKDFSEIADDEKKGVLSDALHMTEEGNFVFMVANTGPLINTFGELFSDPGEKENAKIELINAMDSNTGTINDIEGKKICIINVATVDNTYFATEFVKKLVQDKLWVECEKCAKKTLCHILKNQKLIRNNMERVCEFLDMHYIWLTEHGKRLTIRSMTEQLAYMITGGFECDEVDMSDTYKYLFTNLFFGYIGTMRNPKAINILAIKELVCCGYENKRLRSDETLLVNHEFSKVFEKEIDEILKKAEEKNAYVSGWVELLRRAYFFTNIETDDDVLAQNYEDIFSKQFKRFLQLRNGESTPSRVDANIICDALSMIYVGTTSDGAAIPLTLSRESGIAQNVQLVIGSLITKSIKIIPDKTKDSLFYHNKVRNSLKLEVNKQILQTEITLPLLNYFEELKNGIISTNVDPQLSHGIESLKAELSELMDDADDTFDMIILRNSGIKPVSLEITENRKIREM